MITIFTPTYNRAKLLSRLYDSLKTQTASDFEWLIVDDGSVDDTEHIVKKWIDENIVNIRYIRQENGGKHRAFNNGVKNAKGELFFCVDSDDYVFEKCVELIVDTWTGVKDSCISGIIAFKADINGKLLCNQFPVGVKETNTYELIRKHNCYGEKSLIYKTSVLKEFPYPEIDGEKFIGECVVYDRIDEKYKLLLLPKVITICEYQPDGLTNVIFSNMLKNPTGYKIYYKQRIDMAYTLKERMGYIIRYNAFNIMSDDNKYNYNGKYNLLVLMFKPFGWLLTKYYKHKDATQ